MGRKVRRSGLACPRMPQPACEPSASPFTVHRATLVVDGMSEKGGSRCSAEGGAAGSRCPGRLRCGDLEGGWSCSAMVLDVKENGIVAASVRIDQPLGVLISLSESRVAIKPAIRRKGARPRGSRDAGYDI